MPRAKATIAQLAWNGGINLLAAPNRVGENQARLLQGIDLRSGYALRCLGKSLESSLEVGASMYDNFANEVIDPELWHETDAGSNVSIESTSQGPRLSIAGTGAFDTNGIVAKSNVTTTRTGAFIQIDLTTPAVTTGRFRISLQSGNTALATGAGLELEFDELGNIERLENGVVTDTTQNYAASTTYRIKFVREADLGYKCFISSLSDTTFDNVQLFDTTFAGNDPAFLTLQAHSETWKVRNVVTHEGYKTGAKGPIRACFRWYRVGQDPITIVATDDGLLDFDGTSWKWVRRGYIEDRRWSFVVHRGVVYGANGTDKLQRRSADTWEDVDDAPIGLEHLEVHLERIWGTKDNTVYFSDFINPAVWDQLDDVFDMEAWKGDRLTGIVRIGPTLILFKDNSLWQVLGTLRDNFVLRKIPGAKGCPYPWTIASDGTVIYYMGADGFYRTGGDDSQLISISIWPIFRDGTPELAKIVLGNADGPVATLHDFYYRVCVELGNQATNGFNNVELVFDTIASESGSWTARVNRHLDCYAAFDGHNDDNRLVAGNSNSDGGFYRMDRTFRELRSQFNPVDSTDAQSIDIVTKIITRRDWGDEPVTLNTYHDFRLHYFQNGTIASTVKWFTNRHTDGGTLASIEHTGINSLGGSGFPLSGTLIADRFARGKNNPDQIEAGKHDGEEVWFEISNSSAADWGIMGYEVDFEDLMHR